MSKIDTRAVCNTLLKWEVAPRLFYCARGIYLWPVNIRLWVQRALTQFGVSLCSVPDMEGVLEKHENTDDVYMPCTNIRTVASAVSGGCSVDLLVIV